MSDAGKMTAAQKAIGESWDFWLLHHTLSVQDVVEEAVEKAVNSWLNRHGEALFAAAIEKAASSHMPTADDIVEALRPKD